MAYNSQLRDAAIKYGRQYGIDPGLLIATTLVESTGRLDAVGDGGTSFGPYQMHRGGRLGSYTPQQAMDPWLSTREAAKEFAVFSKRGHRGGALAAAAQRPADPGGYARKVDAQLAAARAILGGGQAKYTGPVNAPITGSSPAATTPQPSGIDLRQIGMAALASRQRGESLTRAVTRQLASARALTPVQTNSGDAVPLPSASPAPTLFEKTGGAASDLLNRKYGTLVGSPLDRPGAKTGAGIMDFARRVAGIYGRPIKLGTGTQHNRLTVNGNVSNHWAGNALDLPESGQNLTLMGQAALIAAGMPEAQARKTKGGLFNIGPWQVIYNTRQGGNHWDHLHVGRRG